MRKSIVDIAFDGKCTPRRVLAKVLFEPIGEPAYTREFTYGIEPLDGETSSELLDRAGMEVLKELNAQEEDEDECNPSPEFVEAFNKASQT